MFISDSIYPSGICFARGAHAAQALGAAGAPACAAEFAATRRRPALSEFQGGRLGLGGMRTKPIGGQMETKKTEDPLNPG
jgi:hypothetical protein